MDEKDNVEIIDLTNETTVYNKTITLEDSIHEVNIEEESYEQDSPQNNYSEHDYPENDYLIDDYPENDSPTNDFLEYPPEPSPIPISSVDSVGSAESLENVETVDSKTLEKLQKEANKANAANKALENCTALIDRNILNTVGDKDEVLFKTFFDESMTKYQLVDVVKIKNGISWTLKRVEVIGAKCEACLKDSTWLLIVMPGSEYLSRLLEFRDNPDSGQSIKTYLNDIKKSTKCDLVLIVYNLANYLKNERSKVAKNYRKNFKDRFESIGTEEEEDEQEKSSDIASIGATDLQDLRFNLEMEIKQENSNWKLHFEFYEKTNEIVQTIVRYTISIAKFELKQKVRSSTGLDWAINMDKEKAVDPTKSSEDLTRLWVTQLQQFSQITLPIAKAIAAEYPSPCALLDQYKNLTTSEAENLLAEIYVQRNLKRQIGTNISKRIHCFMTCSDPDIHIGLGE